MLHRAENPEIEARLAEERAAIEAWLQAGRIEIEQVARDHAHHFREQERARVVAFLRSEAEWIRAKEVLHELPPYDALTIAAEAIETGEYWPIPPR